MVMSKAVRTSNWMLAVTDWIKDPINTEKGLKLVDDLILAVKNKNKDAVEALALLQEYLND